MLLLLSFFFFNDRLEHLQESSNLHQIFRVGRHVAVDVQSGNGQGTLPWQPILGTKSVENRRNAYSHGRVSRSISGKSATEPQKQ